MDYNNLLQYVAQLEEKNKSIITPVTRVTLQVTDSKPAPSNNLDLKGIINEFKGIDLIKLHPV